MVLTSAWTSPNSYRCNRTLKCILWSYIRCWKIPFEFLDVLFPSCTSSALQYMYVKLLTVVYMTELLSVITHNTCSWKVFVLKTCYKSLSPSLHWHFMVLHVIALAVHGFVDVTGQTVCLKQATDKMAVGFLGFLKGTGKGVIGLVLRPTGGLIDFTSTTLSVVQKYALTLSLSISSLFSSLELKLFALMYLQEDNTRRLWANTDSNPPLHWIRQGYDDFLQH